MAASAASRATSSGRRVRAKVFWTGRSQAIRLPKEMRLRSDEVLVERHRDRLIIEPLQVDRDAMGWPRAWWELAGAAPELDLGDRSTPPERGDALAPRRRRRR